MNHFLASLEITFRRDPTNFRPRVNKMNSLKDREQKGKYLVQFKYIVPAHQTNSIWQLLLPRRINGLISFNSQCLIGD